MFDSWLREAAAELGRPELALTDQQQAALLDLARVAAHEQQAALLDLARVAAHAIARPAAPLTTFLAGYALGIGGSLEGLDSVVSALSTAAEAHQDPAAEA